MPHLELVDLRKQFGTHIALDGINLSLEQGEFQSLLGPSGCGKTTALRIVAGFLRPDSGQVLLDGKDISRIAPNKRDMGMVFQAYSLFPNLTASQNVEFGLRVRRQSAQKRQTRVGELLEVVGLSHAADRYPHQLSGGMQQRVALARALAIEPRVLLLDEPLSALDALVRVQLREEIRRVQSQLGITTLYVTHDQEEALSISDHVAVVWAGKIEQNGGPAEIYGEPRTRFVAEFIGTMNRLESTVTDPATGEVAVGTTKLAIPAAKGRAIGDRLLVLVRPEVLKVASPNGSVPGGIGGEVIGHSFLGPVTRVRIAADAGFELVANVPSGEAAGVSIGNRVVATFPSEAARAIELGAAPAFPDQI